MDGEGRTFFWNEGMSAHDTLLTVRGRRISECRGGRREDVLSPIYSSIIDGRPSTHNIPGLPRLVYQSHMMRREN
jgi:hypothetical protein